MKKVFTAATALLLIAGLAGASGRNTKGTSTGSSAVYGTLHIALHEQADSLKKVCGKGKKSCCQQPSKTASLRMAAAKPKPKQ